MINIIKKTFNKRIRLATSLFVVIGFSVALTAFFVGTNIYKIKKAEAFAYDFGGVVMFYNPMCVLDTPSSSPTTCAISCPMCTAFNGGACAGQEEIVFTPFGGVGNFVCPVKGFPYFGLIAPGRGIIGGGGSANSPVMIGGG